ncbi:MAG: hypothetical protein ACOYMW_14915 [Candidatus Competibacteraceae bacterium]
MKQQFPVSFCSLLNRNAIFLNATLVIHKKLLINQSQIKRPGTAVDEAAWAELYSTKSRPFDRPETSKIAVKVINHYGDEVLKVFGV